MNRLDKQDLRQQITEEIADQKILIQRLTETSKPVSPDNAIGRLTRMEAITSRGVSEASLLTAKNKLVKLEKALDKVDLPEFGTCVSCGLAIPAGRILLMPEIEICVSCAEKKSSRH
ncbi:MAG: hypothetical protein G3M78_01565 [Candidatus Nitrohelix vancouverensis]|uniref:Zinc finger DksA/TraR C4-type domain-containing protein n=1 Tax=Candidatus Nitrohelix vancouverensis TaxID=2705534 RepID=A0A7T0G2B1_9BACT|nr:MAG: hypothetical protein G3M78_01565 [Candidatus Nitrohelix vancouverensis]